MERKLFRRYITFGKGDGDELREEYVMEDTPSNRKDIIDELRGDYYHDNVQSFIDGEINTLSYDSDGGDWDDPTGGYIDVLSRKQAEEEVKILYDKSMATISHLFGKEE